MTQSYLVRYARIARRLQPVARLAHDAGLSAWLEGAHVCVETPERVELVQSTDDMRGIIDAIDAYDGRDTI